MEFLSQLDTQLFYFFNVTLQNAFFDWFMPFITEKRHWFPVWGITAILLVWKGGRTGRTAVVLIIPVILLSDQLSSNVLKSYFGRLRPCVALPDIHLLLNKKTSYSMPSSHAVNFFATATVFAYFYRRYKWWFFGTAAVVGYSRIAVGVHYPFDVLVGTVIGIACAALVLFIWKQLESRFAALSLTRRE